MRIFGDVSRGDRGRIVTAFTSQLRGTLLLGCPESSWGRCHEEVSLHG